MPESMIICPLCGHEKNGAPPPMEIQANVGQGPGGAVRITLDITPIKPEAASAE